MMTKKEEKVTELREIAGEAMDELRDETRTEAKKRIKAKLRQIRDAEKVVANLRRELDDLYAELAEG